MGVGVDHALVSLSPETENSQPCSAVSRQVPHFPALVTGLMMHPIIASSLPRVIYSFPYWCFLDHVLNKRFLFESLFQGMLPGKPKPR